ncbi:MAG: hypothetical protein CEN90_670 [Parcubacteria group bacterium Licking1014_17]|nr:MAG: hypothetical protein CEN90_670 [Parcubacteria group bacterium Licking1014_17]
MALDFSFNALRQCREASKRDNTIEKVSPIVADARSLPLNVPESIDAVYSRSSLHLTDKELDDFFSRCKILLKNKGYIMIEGKTGTNSKIKSSKEICPHLYENGGGHIRRLWSEQLIKELIVKHDLILVKMGRTSEIWDKIETQFINFMAQKY